MSKKKRRDRTTRPARKRESLAPKHEVDESSDDAVSIESTVSAHALRPGLVTIAGALLAVAAAALLGEWVLMGGVVESNGAQVFFILLWGYLAVATLRGHGWVRGAIIAILMVTVWGFVNASSWTAALAATSTGALFGKTLAVAALALLFLPATTEWFRSRRATFDALDAAAAAPRNSIVDDD